MNPAATEDVTSAKLQDSSCSAPYPRITQEPDAYNRLRLHEEPK